jgi:uncharacterized protein
MHIEQRTFSQAARRGAKLGASIAFLVLQLNNGLMNSAYAASFKCSPHGSASEKVVCGDPELSALDDKLAQDYRRALDASTDKTALEADRIEQWQWRQRNCTDAVCVKDWYQRRIGELEADVLAGKLSRHDAFERNLADQHLAPSAQAEVRKIKEADGDLP